MEGVRFGRPPSAELRLCTALLELDQRPRLPAAIERGHLARRDRPLFRNICVMYLSSAASHTTPHCPGARCHYRPHGTGDSAGTGHRRLLRRDFGMRIGRRGLRAFRTLAVTQTRLQTGPREPLPWRWLWRGLWRGLRLVEERALDRVGEWAVFFVVRHWGAPPERPLGVAQQRNSASDDADTRLTALVRRPVPRERERERPRAHAHASPLAR